MVQRIPLFVAAAAISVLGCVAQTRRAHEADTSRVPGAGGTTVAMLDTARVRDLCVAPERVLAGQAACVLRDQRAIGKVF